MITRLRTLGALLVVVALAVLLVPSPAFAVTYRSNLSRCYGIKKPGNYNDVHMGTAGVVNGGSVAALGNLAVTYSCQKVNSLPLSNYHIYYVALRINGNRVAVSGSADAHYRAPRIHAMTRYVPVKCGQNLSVAIEVSYRYYDKSVVRPFIVVGATFRRC